MTLGRFKRRQYFVSKWFVNLHLTVIFIVAIDVVTCIDVPRPLINDLWAFLFQTIDAECVKWASLNGTYVYAKALK